MASILAGSVPQTFAGAVGSSALRIHARGANVLELASTGLADAKLSTSPSPRSLDEDLVVLDSLGSGAVASLTRRHEVTRFVVRPIVIKMVDDKRSPSRPCSRFPGNHHITPMTGVRSRTDAVIELDPMLSNETARGSERVLGQSELLAHADLGLDDACVSAGGRAERPVLEMTRRTGYCGSAVLARLGDWHRDLPNGERELTLLQR